MGNQESRTISINQIESNILKIPERYFYSFPSNNMVLL